MNADGGAVIATQNSWGMLGQSQEVRRKINPQSPIDAALFGCMVPVGRKQGADFGTVLMPTGCGSECESEDQNTGTGLEARGGHECDRPGPRGAAGRWQL